MNTLSLTSRHTPLARGVTLIELMVALTLGLLLVSGLLAVFASASSQGQNFARASAQVENGRYVSELLQDDVSMAGYVGEMSTKSVSFSSPSPCATSADVAAAFSYNAATLTATAPTPLQGISASETYSCLQNRMAGTEALVIRRLDTTSVAVSTLPSTSTQYYVQYSFCSTDPTTTLVYSNNKSDFTLHASDCTSLAPVRPFLQRVYYIASCDDCTGAGDGIPTLKRIDLDGSAASSTPTAMADGVYDLLLEYGFDTNNDGDIDEYLAAVNADATQADGQWHNVMAVRVHLITQSTEKAQDSNLAKAQTFQFGQLGPVTTPAGSYTYRGYSTVIRLMNPAGDRESQT